jgi:hypothetical protein
LASANVTVSAPKVEPNVLAVKEVPVPAPIGNLPLMSGSVKVLLELPAPKVVPITLNKLLNAILFIVLPSQTSQPLGIVEPEKPLMIPAGVTDAVKP